MNLTNSCNLICHVCGQEVEGKYYVDSYKRISCCRHQLYQCYCCGRFVNPQDCIEISSYGLFCPDCQQRKVDSVSLVRIANIVNRYYLLQNIRIPEYSLKLIIEEKMLVEAKANNVLGLAFNVKPYEIHIIRNLSRTGLAGVLAHEVLHLWQYEHNFSTPNLLCEGMCELGSYLFLQSINRQEADAFLERMRRNNDKVYGDGFRLFHSIYLKFGWRGVVQALLLRNGK